RLRQSRPTRKASSLTPSVPFATAIEPCSRGKNRSSSRQAIQQRARQFTMFSPAWFARARVARRGSTDRSRARPGRARITRTHGSSGSPTTSSWECGSATTTTRPRGTGGDLPARIWNEFVTQSAAGRVKSVRAQARIAGLSATAAADAKPAASAAVIRGVPVVQSTGVLEIDGRVVRLFGVEGARGRAARDFKRYLGSREVACEPAAG